MIRGEYVGLIVIVLVALKQLESKSKHRGWSREFELESARVDRQRAVSACPQ